MADPFKGKAKKLDDVDLPRIGYRINVGEDEVHAIMDVEAPGSGFDDHGRPKMLFEPHVFYRNLSGEKRARAVKEGLAYSKWVAGKYPKASYPRLMQAIEIDQTAALKSASWGRGQILGENHVDAGFETVQEMVSAMMDDEEVHIDAMVNFLIANKLDDDLREHNWEALARGYNGPAYKVHAYHTRLAQAYRKWARIDDTPWAPTEVVLPPAAPVKPGVWPEDNLALDEVKTIQQKLAYLGYAPGQIDGRWGPNTAGAITAFQRVNSLRPDGHWGPQTRSVLFGEMALRNPMAKLAPAAPTLTADSVEAVTLDTLPPDVQKEIEAMVAALLPMLLQQLAPIIINEVVKAIKHKDVPLNSPAPVVAAEEISNAVVTRIAAIPEAQMVTNTEPWYKSRVTLGAIVSIIASALAVAGFQLTPEDMEGIVSSVLALISALGGIYALYGRWKARVPIGDKPTLPPAEPVG